jgi:hypothetical protein
VFGAAFFDFDITLPCLVHTFTGESCLGCGLTRAAILLVQFDFLGAWNANPLLFAVIPAIGYFLIGWLKARIAANIPTS